jgi:uncharacterized protein involved in outer membrane biogenesis
MDAHPSQKTKRGIRLTEVITAAAIVAAMVAMHLMFYFWPFRYREVHPLLEKVFESRVDVKSYHRTYFPHPGFVAEDVTFYRHGDTHIPPLATVKRMTVAGQWLVLIFHPHTLYQIRLEGLHVQIPPPGTKARGMDFDNGVISTSESELRIESILADGTTLDFLRHGGAPPLRFEFRALVIHNVENQHPLEFNVRVETSEPQSTVVATGKLGPFRTSSYGTTPMSGSYSLMGADLQGLGGMWGHAAAGGRFGGTFSSMDVKGEAKIPDFRVGSGHVVGMDAAYHVTVSGTNGDVEINNADVKTGNSTISASGSVAGSPKKVAVTIAAKDAEVDDLLKIVEATPAQVEGDVNFRAAVEFAEGPGRFLEKLNLKGNVSLEKMRLVTADKQQKVDAFSARVSGAPAGGAAPSDAAQITMAAQTQTRFEHGMAYFPDIHASMPGADAHLQGTFNLLDTRIHLIGKVALERSLSNAVTGWKALLLKPLNPFFKKKDAGAVVAVAITGTARKPKIGQDVMHDK